ncbi:hypothetical protein ABZW32_33930 [Streptomyces sp. NPDC004667]|uniref:hypothetical protein n=1 Tax=Streptomyces sp. NPDC004667 TaxID=3154285 RepID=UPI0033BA0A70
MRHTTLTEHARCIWGDEYGPTPECDRRREHDASYFVEELTFAGPDEIIAMIRELCPAVVDGLLPVWVRNLAYRLLLLQRPDDPALIREAAFDLEAHGPSWDEIAEELRARADTLDPEGAKPWGSRP